MKKYLGVMIIIIVMIALTGCISDNGDDTAPPAAKTWHTVITFTGEETEFTNKNTDIFHIQGAKWKMTWTSIPFNNTTLSTFSAIVYPEGETVNHITYFLSLSGETIIHQGNDNYYLTIIVALLDSWSITIEDYY